MENSLYALRISCMLLGICLLLSTLTGCSKSQQTCPPPDYPDGGNYSPRQTKFQLGDSISYYCGEGHILKGDDTSKCKSSGDWSHSTPFCDPKIAIRNLHVSDGKKQLILVASDGNNNTCFPLKTGERIEVQMDKKKKMHAIRLFLRSGDINIKVTSGGDTFGGKDGPHLETNQWAMFSSEKGVVTNTATITEIAPRNSISNICEIEVYVKEDDGCEKPPRIQVSNGHFEVSRTKATLICVDGYRSKNKRIACEGNDWKNNSPACEEILCTPQKNGTLPRGTEWLVVDPVAKISAGTRKKIRCSRGYEPAGGPETVACQKDGTWTRTTATCVEAKESSTIVIVAVVTVVTLIIISLLGAIIYYVRKQRMRQVVVVYKSPTDGSVISGSEGDYASAHYESIQAVPLPPSCSRPNAPALYDGLYALPLDSKDTLKKKPMPADIAFGPLKQSALYNF